MIFSLAACGTGPSVGSDDTQTSGSLTSDSETGLPSDPVTDTDSEKPSVTASETASDTSSDTDSDTDASSSTKTGSSASASTDTSTDTSSSTDTGTVEPPLTIQDVLGSSEHLVLLTDQKNQRLLVCDLAVEDWSKDKAVVWQYKTYAGVAGIKVRDNEYYGERVVLFCAGTRASIVSYKTKKVLLDTKKAPGNSHSVELLPNGVFVVAGSTGNEVRIYGAGKTTHSDSIAFPSAHGVLWDPKYNVLWISGANQLDAYRVTGTATSPKLELVKDMQYRPNTSLHDLAPVYGNPDALLLTGANGVVLFDKTTGKVSYDYSAGGYLKAQTYVPGVGNYGATDVFVFTNIRKDTLTYKEWGTDRVGVYVPGVGPMGKVIYRQATSDAYYKARVWDPAYQ